MLNSALHILVLSEPSWQSLAYAQVAPQTDFPRTRMTTGMKASVICLIAKEIKHVNAVCFAYVKYIFLYMFHMARDTHVGA